MAKARRVVMAESAERHVDPSDAYGTKVGLQTAILAVFLCIVTILAHRAHIETIVKQNESNDQWSHYQGKRIREYQLELNEDLVKLISPANPETPKLLADYQQKHLKYTNDLVEIKSEAEAAVLATTAHEKRALYYDLSEGVLEISLVLSSLYFISHRKFFPRLGLMFALSGIAAGIIALLFL